MKTPIMLAIIFAAMLLAQAPKLTLKVRTGKGLVGYDVDSTMISGEKDMLVIDAPRCCKRELSLTLKERPARCTVVSLGSLLLCSR
jgi:hypothetical protein